MSRLLLVEDDEALALGIEFTLIDEGYGVLRASTFDEGKKTFEGENPDLIILDVNLPEELDTSFPNISGLKATLR